MTGPTPNRLVESLRFARTAAGNQLGRTRHDIGVLRAARSRTGATGLYLGWIGFGNLGDEALFQAFATSGAAGSRLVGSPFSKPMVAALRASGHTTGVTNIVLGGGTLIGRQPWGGRFESLCLLFPEAARWTVGVGVEDPDEQAAGTRADWQRELDVFLGLAPTFRRFSTRGPRSSEVLRQLGLDAPWVGDPALLLGPAQPVGEFRPQSLLLTVGHVDRIAGSTPEAIMDSVSGSARRLLRAGWSVTVVPVSRRDIGVVDTIMKGLTGHGTVDRAPLTTDWRSFQALAASHHVGLHLRLHPGVLSAATFAPFVQIAYLPKNLDFVESIGHENHTFHARDASAAGLTEAILDVAANREAEQRRLATVVTELRSGLLDEFAAATTPT